MRFILCPPKEQASPVPPPILAFEDVHLSLPSAGGTVDILRGVRLTVAKGESVAIVGPSGSGKSTLLMLSAGLELPSRGNVRALGRDLTSLNEDSRARFRGEHIGIVFQSFHLIPTMTALENTALVLELIGGRKAEARAKEILARVGLSARLSHYPAQLSGGEQQRVALARALISQPSIILADEPTGNLDQKRASDAAALLFELQREKGAALLIATHDAALAKNCQRALHMREGRLTESPKEERE